MLSGKRFRFTLICQCRKLNNCFHNASIFSRIDTAQPHALQKIEFLETSAFFETKQMSTETENTCDHPAKWTKGKKLRITDKKIAAFIPLPETVDEVEFIECVTSEFDLRSNTELDLLIFRRHIGPVRVYFPPNLRRLVIDHSQIEFMTPLPDSLTSLIVRDGSALYDIAHLPKLETLVWDYNTTPELPTLPTCLKNLHYTNSLIERLPNPLPPALNVLICRCCRLTGLPPLPPLPPTLEWLRIHEMEISSLPTLPTGLLCLDVQDCALTDLPPLPKRLDELDVRNNRITRVPEIPATATYVNICGNPIETYPYIYRTNISIMYDYNSYVAAFSYPKFHIDRMIVFTPLHLLEGLDVDIDQDPYMDIYEDEGYQLTLIRRLEVLCEIQKQVACRAFLKTIKEELMMRTWHPSRVEAWCGVDFGCADD